MNGEFIGEGWKYGLIEVDLMPTLAESLLHSWGRSVPVCLIRWLGNRSSLAWTLSLTEEDVN